MRARIEITLRGRRVAILAPSPDGTPLDRLRALGDVDIAKGSLDELPAPLVPSTRVERPSDVLRRLRRDER